MVYATTTCKCKIMQKNTCLSKAFNSNFQKCQKISTKILKRESISCKSPKSLALVQKNKKMCLVKFQDFSTDFQTFLKLLLNALDKCVVFYMILHLQVVLAYTIVIYTYQRVFRAQKLIMKKNLTEGSSPTVHCQFQRTLFQHSSLGVQGQSPCQSQRTPFSVRLGQVG